MTDSPSALSRAPARPSARVIITVAIIAGCVALFIGLRCIKLNSDAPLRVLGYEARELFAEPPAKSHEARNYALFGAYKLSPADDYQFWRAQSPLWVYPLTAFFQWFGVNYPQLRVFSTLYAALGFLALLAFASRYVRPITLAFIGLTIAADAVYLHTSRVGIVEPTMSGWLALSMLALLLAQRRLAWLSLAHLAFVGAFFTKQGALFAFPVIAAATFVRLHAVDRNDPVARRDRRRVWMGIAVLAIASVTYILCTDYARTVIHNVNHLLIGYDTARETRVSTLSSWWLRVLDLKHYAHFFASAGVSGPIAIATVLGIAADSLRRRRFPSYAIAIVVSWFVCGLAGCMAVAESQLRFWTVIVMPAAVLSGIGLERAFEHLQHHREDYVRRLAYAPYVVLAVVLLAWNLPRHIEYLAAPSYSVKRAARFLTQTIGDQEATVIGLDSPGVVLGTKYRNFYVRPRMNTGAGKVDAFGVTHLLFNGRHDGASGIIRTDYPRVFKRMRWMRRIEVRDQRLSLYDFAAAKGGARRKPEAINVDAIHSQPLVASD